MIWDRKELKEIARNALKINYWKSVLIALLLGTVTQHVTSASGMGGGQAATERTERRFTDYMSTLTSQEQQEVMFTVLSIASAVILAVIVIAILAILLDIFVFNPLMVGIRQYSLKTVREKHDGMVSDLGCGFDTGYRNNVKTLFMTDLFISLWSLLFVVPGIIKMYEYRMVSFILIDNPDLDYKTVQAMSRQMMYGNKWKAFVLDLSFIGWDILNSLTLGILGMFYIAPYKMLTDAALYDALTFEQDIQMTHVMQELLEEPQTSTISS